MSKITFLPEVDHVSESQLFIVEEQLKKLEPKLIEKLPKYLDFLNNEQNTLGGIELHWPFFDLGITLMLSIIGKKLQISVLDHKNCKIFGNVLVEGFDCMNLDELKKLATWNNYSGKKLSILKPLE